MAKDRTVQQAINSCSQTIDDYRHLVLIVEVEIQNLEPNGSNIQKLKYLNQIKSIVDKRIAEFETKLILKDQVHLIL